MLPVRKIRLDITINPNNDQSKVKTTITMHNQLLLNIYKLLWQDKCQKGLWVHFDGRQIYLQQCPLDMAFPKSSYYSIIVLGWTGHLLNEDGSKLIISILMAKCWIWLLLVFHRFLVTRVVLNLKIALLWSTLIEFAPKLISVYQHPANRYFAFLQVYARFGKILNYNLHG